MRNLFLTQSKIFAHPEASTMLEDLAIRGLQNGFSDEEIVLAIREFYRQCEEVALENLRRAKNILNK